MIIMIKVQSNLIGEIRYLPQSIHSTAFSAFFLYESKHVPMGVGGGVFVKGRR